MLGHNAEGMVDRFLNKNLVPLVGKALYTKVDAADHAGDVGNFLAFQVHAKLFVIPTTDIVPLIIVAAGITQNALLKTTLHGF